MGYQFGLPNEASIKFTAEVENIFDEKYQEHLDWGVPKPVRDISMKVTCQV